MSSVIHGDCLDVMPTLEAESIDAVVTDPPYGLEFMGKEWDKLGAVALHDPSVVGGFQDGHGGNPFSRSRVRFGRDARSMQAWHEAWAREALRVAKPSAYLLSFGGTRTVHRLACAIEDAGWIIRDMLVWGYASGFPKGRANLKPAWEPIVMARKPGPLRELAIDACRIPAAADDLAGWHAGYDGQKFIGNVYGESDTTGTGMKDPAGRWHANIVLTDPIFDGGWDGVVGGGEAGGGFGVRGDGPLDGRSSYAMPGQGQIVGYGDSGTYSRFFIIPKADRSDREPVLGGLEVGTLRPRVGTVRQRRANVHPTVKPTDLMRHLVRLVTPSGGTVLDPFLGSGTTALAAEMEGFSWVGIEKEAEYVAIAEARLNGTQRGMAL